ncbi:MAG: hypothetical protein ABSG36_06185 [Acidimicrobiales bacterium]
MRKLLAALGAVLVLAGLLGGCTASRNALGTHDSACFRVLPEALSAIHHHGHFEGERYLPPRALILDLHRAAVPKALQVPPKVATCLVAFTGHFSATTVKLGWSPTGKPGRIAIVIVRQRNLALIATVVLVRIPPKLIFGHVFPRLV